MISSVLNISSGNNICIGSQATSNGNTNCIIIGSGAYANGNNQIILGAPSGPHTTHIKGSGGLNVTGSVTLSKPLILGSLPTTDLTVLGGSIKYSFVGGLVFEGGSVTFGSFTNVSTGIYLLTVGTFTIYNIDPADRFDIVFNTATNITFISSSTNMEFGGNTAGKFGIGFTIPISVTSSTNQLTITGYAFTGNANYLGGASSLLRIA
jgi:hypothetical protein